MIRHLVCLMLSFILAVVVATSAFAGIESELFSELRQVQALVDRSIDTLMAGGTLSAERTSLERSAENLRINHLLLDSRFDDTQQLIDADTTASSRYADTYGEYQIVLNRVLSGLDEVLAEAQPSLANLERLQDILKPVLAQRPRPIHGSLPYRQLSLPAVAPDAEPSITPAYRLENILPVNTDLLETPEVERNQEIAELARSLNWNPVRMYEWVVNNIETEWYWGVKKGAHQTLLQKSGNDADQAALLVALMRASDYPARFVRGKVGLFPNTEEGLQRMGLSDISALMDLLQRAGIPYKPVIAGGRVADVEFEHLWCEVYVPYSNYRGTVLDAEGKVWVPLDTSIKPLTTEITPPCCSQRKF